MASTAASAGVACPRSADIWRPAHTRRNENNSTPNDHTGSAHRARRSTQAAAQSKPEPAGPGIAARIVSGAAPPHPAGACDTAGAVYTRHAVTIGSTAITASATQLAR